MARKPREITDQTYDLLLDAAEDVFSKKGYAEATFQDIARHAGMTRGAIYWHFKDKPRLLDAVLQRAELPWDRLPTGFDSLAQAPTLIELSKTLGDGLAEIARDPRLHRITLILLHRTELIAENHQIYSRLTAILHHIKSYITAALRWRFRDEQGSPHAGISDAAASIKALMTGIVYEWMLNRSEMNLDEMRNSFERLIPSMILSRLMPNPL